jgi:hypothetical protein
MSASPKGAFTVVVTWLLVWAGGVSILFSLHASPFIGIVVPTIVASVIAGKLAHGLDAMGEK